MQEENKSCQNSQERNNLSKFVRWEKKNEKKLSWVSLIRLMILTRDQAGRTDKCSILSVEADVAR